MWSMLPMATTDDQALQNFGDQHEQGDDQRGEELADGAFLAALRQALR